MPRFNPPSFPFVPDGSINSHQLQQWLIAITEWAREVDPALDRLRAEIIPDTLAEAKGDLLVASADDLWDRLPVGPNGTFPVADSTASLGLAYKGGMVEIESQVDPSGNVIFSNIPGHFKDLLLTGQCRHDDASATNSFRNFALFFNGDTGTNYVYLRDQTDGAGSRAVVASSADAARMQLGRIGDVPGAVKVLIPNYTGGFQKSVIAQVGGAINDPADGADNWLLTESMGRWKNGAIITEVAVNDPGGGDDWRAETRFTLYGLG